MFLNHMIHPHMDNENKPSKKLYFILWTLCLIGSWSIIPYIQYAGILPPSVSMLKFFLLATIQAALLYAVICYASYKLVPKTDLQPFLIKNTLKQIVYPGVIAGILLGFAVYFLNQTLFANSLIGGKGMHPPIWTGALASLYGAVNEEVLLRLFLFTLVYFIFGKIFKFAKQNKLLFLWITNVIVAIIFGLGHLPAAYKLIEPSSLEILRILVLNCIPGIVFGWLYWSKGLWSAMTAHFVADLMIHVLLH